MADSSEPAPPQAVEAGEAPAPTAARKSDPTEEYRAFLAIKERLPAVEKTVQGEACTYTLHAGSLVVSAADGSELWRSDPYWWVDDFALADVDGDGNEDFLFTLWKSYSFYGDPPQGVEADDPAVKNHLFLYSMRGSAAKQLWCSSNLSRPICTFELEHAAHLESPVSSGMKLITQEGEYRADFAPLPTQTHEYLWEGWGFTPQTPA
ncbi:MAG: hypothetical protein LBU48_00905 [Coriobacteriales bacterium]|nr:hypothetical protein [Coriobacteriales bacterium]